MSRALANIDKNAKLADLIGTPGNALRDELSGLLRPQLLAMLDDVRKNNGEVYAALYELNDPELIAGLTALGKKCHLLLAAEDGILFLFFNPGAFVSPDEPTKWTLLQNILVRHQADGPHYDLGLYMRGVVNQEIPGLTSPATAPTSGASKHATLDPSVVSNPVTLFRGGGHPPQRLTHEAMVPKNIKTTFHNWAEEMLGSGVHIHSKVIVLDPFGKNPVVMTGSHNLGYKASSKNDDNLMIVEGNAPLAAAFAANIIAMYQTYRWNAHVEAHRQDPHVWHGLVDSDAWQDSYLKGDDLAELQFWMGESPTAPAASTATPVRSVRPPSATKAPKNVPAKKPAPVRKKAQAKK